MAALVRGGRICRDKKNGGSGGVGASSSAGTKSSGCSGAPECTLVHDPQVHTLENVVPAPTTVGQPPRKNPQSEQNK
ncbi:hypothetical protein Tco_0264069, partial [Tanacetum coccineum]